MYGVRIIQSVYNVRCLQALCLEVKIAYSNILNLTALLSVSLPLHSSTGGQAMKQRTKQPYNLCPGMSSEDALFLAVIKRVGSLDLIRGRIAIYRAVLPYDGHPSARNPISHMVDVSPLIRFKTNTIYGDYIMCAHALTERQTNRQTDRRAERKTGR